MNLIDRLLVKAQTIQLTYGNDVFIIIREVAGWAVDGQRFLDLEAAQGYVEGLVPDNNAECTVIINDAPPFPGTRAGKRTEEKKEAVDCRI